MALISFGYRVDMNTIASPSNPSGFVVAYDLDGYLKQKDYYGVITKVGSVSPINNVETFTFSSNLIVSLSNGKSFGKYESGTTIPALGKTTSEVIIDSLSEPLNPILTLECDTIIKYNQNNISNVLTFSHQILSLDATIYLSLLEYRKNNTGDWTSLSYSPNSPDSPHETWDPGFNTEPHNYRYTVIDTKGASSSITKDVIPMSYIPPTINLTVTAGTKNSPETNLKREKGNILSYLSGTVSRNTELVDLVSYQLQYQKAGSSTWLPITAPIEIIDITNSIDTVSHSDATLSNLSSVLYRVLVTDTHQNTESAPIKVDFLNMIFFGSTSSVPTTSNEVRSLSNRIFTDGSNPFILNTGLTYSNFIVAMPETLTLSGWSDLDSTGANISYISKTFSVSNFDGRLVSYKIYSSTQAVPYSPDHRHQITRF